MTKHPVITALGAYAPERVLSNADLERMVETSDEWIVQRTGIRERRIAADDAFTSDLCREAVKDMVRRYHAELSDVDMIIACTHTPDLPFPGVSARIAHAFSLERAGALDLNATCAGFVYGLHTAGAYIAAGLHRKVLVVAGDTMSKITDYSDRTTCVLFGDGAGAALVEAGDAPSFLAHDAGNKGDGGIHLYRTGIARTLDGQPLAGEDKVVQNGREVYRYAVTTVPKGMQTIMDKAGLPLSGVDWFIPHSANLRMIESICDKTGFPMDKTLCSMVEFGNTSAATIPLAMAAALDKGKIKRGDLLLLYGFGGGLTHAGLLLRWSA